MLYLGEYCYNTTYHISIRMTPFKALYGYEALNFADLAFGAEHPRKRIGYRTVKIFLRSRGRTYKQHRINISYKQKDT